jgi:hypothetical protein
MESGAKSYMRKGFPIYEEMRKFFPIYEEAVSHMTLQPIPLNFLIYEENFMFFFIMCSPNLLCASHYEWLMLLVKKLRRLICHHLRHNGDGEKTHGG